MPCRNADAKFAQETAAETPQSAPKNTPLVAAEASVSTGSEFGFHTGEADGAGDGLDVPAGGVCHAAGDGDDPLGEYPPVVPAPLPCGVTPPPPPQAASAIVPAASNPIKCDLPTDKLSVYRPRNEGAQSLSGRARLW